MKDLVFLFNKLNLSISLNRLKQMADIDEIESGHGYTFDEPRMLFKNGQVDTITIVDFCMTKGGATSGEFVIGVLEKDGKVTEYYADWCVCGDNLDAVRL